MSAKRTGYFSLLFLIALAIIFLVISNSMPYDPNYDSSNPKYFPRLLSVLLIIMAVINFFQTRKEEDKKIEIPNIKGILLTIGITVVYFLCWTYLGYFYIFTFIYLFVLFTYFNPTKKYILLHLGISLVLSFFVYGLFYYFLNIRF